MTRARRSIEVGVSAEAMFQVITDYASYPEFIPEMTQVEIIEDRGVHKTVTFELEIFKIGVRYTVAMEEEPYRRLSWVLVDSNWIRLLEGFWLIESKGRRLCEITYNQEIKLKGFMPRSVSNKLVQFMLPAMLGQFKRRAEGLP